MATSMCHVRFRRLCLRRLCLRNRLCHHAFRRASDRDRAAVRHNRACSATRHEEAKIHHLRPRRAGARLRVDGERRAQWQLEGTPHCGVDRAARAALAAKHKYSVNRQASGLRKSKSGLIGMIIPLHDNRFFSAMAKSSRSSRASATGTRSWSDAARSGPGAGNGADAHFLPHRNIYSWSARPTRLGQPRLQEPWCGACQRRPTGTTATSVISDNYWGAQQLTQALIDRSTETRARCETRPTSWGIGDGLCDQRRIEGFSDVIKLRCGRVDADQSMPAATSRPRGARREQAPSSAAGLPRALFINSTIALEGVVRFLQTLDATSSRAAPWAATTGTRSPAYSAFRCSWCARTSKDCSARRFGSSTRARWRRFASSRSSRH